MNLIISVSNIIIEPICKSNFWKRKKYDYSYSYCLINQMYLFSKHIQIIDKQLCLKKNIQIIRILTQYNILIKNMTFSLCQRINKIIFLSCTLNTCIQNHSIKPKQCTFWAAATHAWVWFTNPFMRIKTIQYLFKKILTKF